MALESTPRQPYAIRGKLAIGGALEMGAIIVEDGRIAQIVRSPHDGALPGEIIEAPIVAPGLIDLQVNGGFGVDVGADPAALGALARRLPETGVTAYLPTLISSPAEVYAAAFTAFGEASNAPGARALGFHLEGPYLAPARKGAHPLAAIAEASPRILDAALASGLLRLMTLAPERPDAIQHIRRLRDDGVLVSLGHTDATFDEFQAGAGAGAGMATHLFNAMSPFGHRAPGAIGAALTDDRVTVGLIADGVHCHPASLRLAIRAKGVEHVALVTDMMAAAGMPPGRYDLGGQPVETDGESARLADGTLAGAVLTLDRAARNVVRWGGVTAAEALRMATEVPARLLGMSDRGRLVVGGVADLALFDDDLHVLATVVGGDIVFRRG
jgi:N-acetylglucosamine-6-phosphate deacetylase